MDISLRDTDVDIGGRGHPQEKIACNFWKFLAFVSLNILEYLRYSNILDLLGITWWYWPLEYSRNIHAIPSLKFCPSAWNFMDILEHSTGQYQGISRKSKVLPAPQISLEFLESSWFVGFSGISLQKERQVDIF